MKKITFIFLSVLCLIVLTGCSSNSSNTHSDPQGSKFTSGPIVSSTKPAKLNPNKETTGQNTSASTVNTNSPAKESNVERVTTKPITAMSSSVVSATSAESKTTKKPQEDDTMPTINIQIGGKNFTAIFYDNESARAIVKQMPFTLEMDDFASQEKVTDLTFNLPSGRTQVPAQINSGDIYLWSGTNLVLFYTTFSNSYSYVPVGYIENVTGLKDALGSGGVRVTFSVVEMKKH